MSNNQLPIPPPPFARTGVFGRFGSIEDLTAEYIKTKYLVGLTFVDADGNPYPAEWYEQKINVAISLFEHYTDLTVTPTDILAETHDYYIKDYQLYCFIQLYKYPIIVNNNTPVVKAIYPTGDLITTFPREWVRPDAQHGQLQLVPTQGTLSQVILGQGGSYLPIIYQGLGYLPQLFSVDYKAGFETGKVPMMILDAIAKIAAINLYSTIADSVYPAGVTNQSLSIDGMSESRGFQNAGQTAPVFSGTINQYQRELFGDPRINMPGLLQQIKTYYKGINAFVTA